MNFPRQTVLDLCRKYGPYLRCPDALNGAALMAAIAANESSLGADCTPRYELSYDKGGSNARNPQQIALLARYGREGACSYGPWQVMLVNAPGMTPQELTGSADAGAQAFVAYFNRYIIRVRQPETLEQIAQCYNAGQYNPNARIGVKLYADRARANYTKLLAELSQAKEIVNAVA